MSQSFFDIHITDIKCNIFDQLLVYLHMRSV